MKQIFELEDDLFVKLDFNSMEIKVSDILDNLSETDLYTVLRIYNIKDITRFHHQLGLMIEEFWEDQKTKNFIDNKLI